MKRYIKSNTSEEKTFVRFGKRFKHGKSINYLAMNPRIKDDYSYKLAELQYGYIDEDEFNDWCENALEDFVWEPNTSCFYCDKTSNLPIVKNVSQVKTLIGFIQRFEQGLPCQAFLVQGEQVGVGTDKEPLVNVTQEESIEYDIDDLIDVALNALKNGFKTLLPADNNSDDFIYTGGSSYQYKNMIFMNPKPDFIANYEYQGPVMDKFKYETEIAMDYDSDDFNWAIIPCGTRTNGSKDEIADCINEWGNDIYSKPFYFENKYKVAIATHFIWWDHIIIYGHTEDIENFLDEYPVDWRYLDEDESSDKSAQKLKQKFLSMKFYK